MSARRLHRLTLPGILIRTYGWRGIVRRGVHELRRSTGWFKTHPTAVGYSSRGKRTVTYGPLGDFQDLPPDQLQSIVARGQRVVGGEYQAYGGDWRRLPDAKRWRVHPTTGFEFPADDWWKVPLLPPGADIKDVWEPARFSWVYDLVRAHMATGDQAYASIFHKRLVDWQTANPPFLGPHWGCGQEIAIRALAILHAEENLAPLRDKPVAIERIKTVLGWSGERIANAIGYGLSQRNNHGISESAGLVHIGLRLQGQHDNARRWLSLGTRLLSEQICDQFEADGWYAQHSFTYMRVALEQALSAERALSTVGAHLSRRALERIDAAVDLLGLLADVNSGELPNHGANDGARVLPLSTAEYRDFRPLLTFAAIVRSRPLPANLNADEEVVRWLGGDSPMSKPARADGVMSGPSGWVTAKVGRCSVFMHAGMYRHRPSHLDALHLDVRIDGKEVITDPGTYAYNAPVPWNNGLASALVHNGPILDWKETAERGPRFLWLSWPASRLVATEEGEHSARIVAERLGAVRREVLVTADTVRVTDRALNRKARCMQVTWLLHPDAAGYSLDSEDSRSILPCEEDVNGWYSPTYGLRRKSRAVRIVRHIGDGPGTIETKISAACGV